MRAFLAIVTSVGFLCATDASAAIVNIDARFDAANSPQTLHLEPGTYHVVPIVDVYTAWSSHLGQANSWRHAYVYSSSEIGEVHVGTPPISCGTPGTCFNSAAEAFAADATTSSFTLSAADSVDFFICDGGDCFSFAGDNVGGVSLAIIPIPPAVWLFGCGLLWLAARVRSSGRLAMGRAVAD